MLACLPARLQRLAVLCGLALAASTAAAAATAPITSDQFAPGWQDAARPLFFHGPAWRSGTGNVWQVEPALAAGQYVLIERHGDKAEVVPGHQFHVDSDPNAKIELFVEAGYNDLASLPVKYLPTPGAAAPASTTAP